MKYLGILVVLVSMFLLFGCTSQSSTAGQGTPSSGTGNTQGTGDQGTGSATNTSNVTNTGTTYTTTTQEGNTTVTTNINPSGSDWCVAGQYYNISETGSAGTVTGDIKGIVTYKGGQYCKIDATVNTGGYSISYTYYVGPDKKDMWVVTSIGGQTQEIHVNTETGEVITS